MIKDQLEFGRFPEPHERIFLAFNYNPDVHLREDFPVVAIWYLDQDRCQPLGKGIFESIVFDRCTVSTNHSGTEYMIARFCVTAIGYLVRCGKRARVSLEVGAFFDGQNS